MASKVKDDDLSFVNLVKSDKKCVSFDRTTLEEIELLKAYLYLPDDLSFSATIRCIVARLYWEHLNDISDENNARIVEGKASSSEMRSITKDART